MAPQLTIQTPLQLPPDEIPSYLNQLWEEGPDEGNGSNTFCLIIWQPAWIEQHLIRTGKIEGPIIGTKTKEVIDKARQIVLEEEDLPHCTPAFDEKVAKKLSQTKGNQNSHDDLRGQYIESSISVLNPRRLITLAPTIQNTTLQTLVAAYCPLPEELGGDSACGDVVVFKGNEEEISAGIPIIEKLLIQELPTWIWWNGSLNETNLLNELDPSSKRIIIDSACGDPKTCLDLLEERIEKGEAVNDLNWLRLRSWRETLAMVFDPPSRQNYLNNASKLDIDIQGDNPVQGLLLASWMADRLHWDLKGCKYTENGALNVKFNREDGGAIDFCLNPLPIGNPSIHPGQIVGIRLICHANNIEDKSLCVILASESGECMRLEAGGMARMELLEELVPLQTSTGEMDVARLLSSSRGTTSPLLSRSAPIAARILKTSSNF